MRRWRRSRSTSARWKLPWEGGCRCGGLRIKVAAPPLIASACHCRGCQRMTGSAYALTLTFPGDGLAVKAGEPVVGGLHGATRHMHCPYCLSWVFTRPDEMNFVNLRATMLDNARWFAPYIEVFTAEKLPWAQTGAVHSYETHPDFNAYRLLIQAFAKDGARPV